MMRLWSNGQGRNVQGARPCGDDDPVAFHFLHRAVGTVHAHQGTRLIPSPRPRSSLTLSLEHVFSRPPRRIPDTLSLRAMMAGMSGTASPAPLMPNSARRCAVSSASAEAFNVLVGMQPQFRAGPAHVGGLHQSHFGTGLGRRESGGVAAGAAANDGDCVAPWQTSFVRPLQNGDLLRQRKKSRPLMYEQYTARPGFFASLHLTIFERPAIFEFFNSQLCIKMRPSRAGRAHSAWSRASLNAGRRKDREGDRAERLGRDDLLVFGPR